MAPASPTCHIKTRLFQNSTHQYIFLIILVSQFARAKVRDRTRLSSHEIVVNDWSLLDDKSQEHFQIRKEEIKRADGQVFCKLGGTVETSKKCSDIVRTLFLLFHKKLN